MPRLPGSPPSMTRVALPALELPKEPDEAILAIKIAPPSTVKTLESPAVDSFQKNHANFLVIHLLSRSSEQCGVICYPFATKGECFPGEHLRDREGARSGAATTASTAVSAESEIAVTLETSTVAISVGLLGTVFGIQLASVFQSPFVGLRFQVALPSAVQGPDRWRRPKRPHNGGRDGCA